jgi:DNA-binding response OmpR family regulator
METIRQIRKSDMYGSQFVIGVSAFSDNETVVSALAAGMNDFIEKPLTISALKECCLKNGIENCA